MLTALALSLGVSLLAAVYGRAVLVLFGRLAGGRAESAGPAPFRPVVDFSVAALVGLGVLSAGTGVVALFSRIGAGALAAALAGGVLLAWLGRGRGWWVAPRRERAVGGRGGALVWVGRKGPGSDSGWTIRFAPLPVLLGGAALLLGALLALGLTALPPANYDSGAYHAQTIRWLEEAGLVPGLGNLHDRLAFSAGWFVPAALFSLAFLGGPSLHVLNGTLVLLLLAWAAGALAAWRAGGRSSSLVLRLVLPAAALGLFGRWLSSPAPDVAVAVLLWAAAALTLETLEAPVTPETSESGGSAAELTRLGAVAALAGFAVAVKLSALPVLALPVLLAGRRLAAGRRAVAGVFAALALIALLVVPTVAQTVVTTGHPVFPLPGLDPFDFDWEMPAWLVERQARWIPTWARVPHRPTAEVEAMGAGEWLPLWWEHMPASARAALAAVLVLLPLRAALALFGRGGRDGRGSGSGRSSGGSGRPGMKSPGYDVAPAEAGFHHPPDVWGSGPVGGGSRDRLLLEAALLGGLAFWFVLAPDPRFGWGFLLPLVVLLADGVARALGRRFPGRDSMSGAVRFAGLPGALLLAVVVVQAWQIQSWEPRTFATAARYFLLPADYPQPSGLREATLGGGLRVQVPFPNDRCWYHPWPCTPLPDPRLELRGRTLADGFRLRAVAPPPVSSPSRPSSPR
jgi:uncharacterized membrane protein YgcG